MRYVLFFLILFFALGSFGQIEKLDKSKEYSYYEKLDDPYIAVPEKDKKTSPAYSLKNSSISITQVNVDDLGNNIIGDAANEPSLAIDPTNPNKMAVGWRQFETIQSNFRQAGNSYTLDGGITWLSPDPIEEVNFRSDPVLDTDNNGNFFYNSLNDQFICDVFKTSDLEDWSNKTYAHGGDKQWMVVDKTNSTADGHIYAFWKAQFSACNEGSFTRSTDNGQTYEDCVTVPDNPTRGTLAIGPDSELYACGGWNSTFKVLKSSTARDPAEIVDWELNVTVDLKGSQALYDGPNPGGMLGQVWVAVDHSESPTRGNVYLLSAVTRTDNSDPADIMFSRSTDGGENWTEAININDDNSTSNWQWFGSLSVAPNGRIDVTWYDTRDDQGGLLSALYYSYSLDGGITWSVNEKLSDSFDTHLGWPNQQKIGDYNHMISYDEGAHLAWAATFNGEQDVFYSFIPAPVTTSIFNPNQNSYHIEVIPNPVNDQSAISFYVEKNSRLKIEILDVLGNKVEELSNSTYSKGHHQLIFNPLI